MAVTFAQGKSALDNNNSTTAAVTLDSTPSDGQFVVISIGNVATTAVSSISGGGTGWTQAKQTTNSGVYEEIWYAYSTGAQSATITVTFAAKINGNKSLNAAVFDGVKASSPIDTTGATTGSGSTYSTGTTGTTTDAGDVVVGGTSFGASSTINSGPTNSFSNVATFASGVWSFAAYRIATATGTYQTQWATTNSRTNAGAIVAFLPAVTWIAPSNHIGLSQAVHRAATW